MFTSWDQVQSWIEDNNFARWIFYKNNPEGREDKATDIIIDSKNFTVSDFHDKLAMTEKYIRMYGAKVYGVGYQSPESNRNGVYCEVRIQEDAPAQGTNGIGGGYPSIGELTETITKQVRAEIEAENMRKREADLDKREKELQERENSAMGAIAHYLAPLGQMIMQKKMGMPRVAGVDANEDVHAQIIAHDPQEQELVDMANESDFTEEEEQKIYDLLSRFKKAEPEHYLQMIETVVMMAENGDPTYNMAKGFLIKG